jgi:hypothetical protein
VYGVTGQGQSRHACGRTVERGASMGHEQDYYCQMNLLDNGELRVDVNLKKDIPHDQLKREIAYKVLQYAKDNKVDVQSVKILLQQPPPIIDFEFNYK